MRKGFGFYSPHESSIFFLKTVLVSFWIGVDVIAMLVISTIPDSVIARHGVLTMLVALVPIAGTVFSALFVWATGTLVMPKMKRVPTTRLARLLQEIKQDRRRLLAAGAVVVAVVMCGTAGYIKATQNTVDTMAQLGRADMAVGRKCEEVAQLEASLFQSDEQLVMAQCLIQYDRQYAAALGTPVQRR